jgi:hypothetical protein
LKIQSFEPRPTFRLFERVRRRSANLDFTFVDLTDLSHLKEAIKQQLTKGALCQAASGR